MDSKRWSWCLEKTIPSDVDVGHGLIEELNQALEAALWCGRDVFKIQLAAEEAMVNAIEHGNRRDASKKVEVGFFVGDDEVRISFTDQGSGFNPDTLPDPTDDELLEKPRGRGVRLIQELMDEVCYNAAGNSVTLVKYRSAPDAQAVGQE
jgi:serine/threonine-protein kinase RsbW